jgi:mycothiol synthase
MQESEERAPRSALLPDGPDGIIWRRIRPDDLDSVHAIARGIAAVDEPGHPPGRAEIEQQLTAVDPTVLTALALEAGRPVAFGIVFVTPFAAAVRLPGGALPEARGAGIGRRLLAWQVAQAHAVRPSKDTPISARQPIAATRTAALLAHAGFRPERTFLSLRRAPGPVTPAPLPDGLRSVPLAPRFDEPLRLAKNRAFADHWRSPPETPTGWAQHQLGPWLGRDLSRLALTDDDRIAGFVVSWIEDAAPEETYVALVGTDPEWRGQGVARALLTEVLEASAAAGRPGATLDVDGESATGADRLYASIGFERVSETLIHGLLP